jgi:hypothetical protein
MTTFVWLWLVLSQRVATQQDGIVSRKDSPRNPQPAQRILHNDKVCENTNQHAAGGEHDDYPEVELLVRPVVALAHDDALARYAAPHAGGVRGSQFGDLMEVDGPARSASG